jgi:hypothetical protein
MRRSEEEEAAPTIGRLEYTALIQLADVCLLQETQTTTS